MDHMQSHITLSRTLTALFGFGLELPGIGTGYLRRVGRPSTNIM